MSKDDLSKAWRTALPAVSSASNAFQAVTWPAGAFVASAKRIGWRIPAAHVVIGRRGQQFDLKQVCPKLLLKHAERDLRILEAATSTSAARIGGAPDFEPLRDYLASKKGKEMPGRASLKAMGEGGWWTQQRLHAEGVYGVHDDRCRACAPASPGHGTGAPFDPAVGAVIHRALHCGASSCLRAEFKDQAILQTAQRHGDPRSHYPTLPLYQH